MVDEQKKAEIMRMRHVLGLKTNTIARLLGIHHSTVERVLDGRERQAPSRPKEIDSYRDYIERELEKHPDMTASRLFELTRARGYEGGLDHFRHELRALRPRTSPEPFLRLQMLAGEQGQVDWGHFGHIMVRRARRRVMAFVIVLAYSRAIFLRFFHDEKTPSFLRGHQEAFEFFGGVPKTLLYDNLKSVVISRIGDHILFNDEIVRFAGQCLFEPRAANVRRGNEKGRVERAIRYVRTSFWPGRHFDDLDDLNRQARAWIEGRVLDRPWPQDRSRTVRTALEEERQHLLPVPQDLSPIEEVTDVKVPKWPYVRFDRNDYTVPAEHVQKTLVVRATDGDVRVLDGARVVAHHKRSYGSGEVIEDAEHTKEVRVIKRRARRGATMHRVIASVPAAEKMLQRLSEEGRNIGAAVNRLARLLDLHGSARLAKAIEEALEKDTCHVHAVQMICERIEQAQPSAPRLRIQLDKDSKAAGLSVRMADYRTFGRLLHDGGEDEETAS